MELTAFNHDSTKLLDDNPLNYYWPQPQQDQKTAKLSCSSQKKTVKELNIVLYYEMFKNIVLQHKVRVFIMQA